MINFPLVSMAQKSWNHIYRRLWSSAPTSKNAETDVAWMDRQFRYYATAQPYTSPLTLTRGNLTGETWEMRQAYREWAIREPAAKSALLTKCLAVCQLDPQLKPADKRRPLDREAADWVKWAVDNSAEGWPGLIFNMIFPACMDGFSVTEKVFGKVDEHGSRYHGWWTLKSAASIDSNLTRFRLDTYRQVIGIQSVAGTQAAYHLEPSDFIIFTHLKIFENPFGNSDMRAAVRACTLIESAIRLRHILLTNYSGPFIKATAGDNAARMKLMSVLSEARANGWIVVPTGSEVEVLSLSVANLESFRSAVEDYRQEIVQSIQGAYLQLLEGGITDARGNTQVHKSISELFQWWLAAWVCQVINKQLIPDLVTPNYGNRAGFPRVSLGGIDEDTTVKTLGRFKLGHELGAVLSYEQVRDAGGLEVPRDKSDELPPPQQQQQGGTGGGGGMFDGLFGGDGGAFRKDNPQEGGPGNSPATFRGHSYAAAVQLLGIHPDNLPDTAQR